MTTNTITTTALTLLVRSTNRHATRAHPPSVRQKEIRHDA